MELSERQKAIIVGGLLGDSSIEKRWQNPRIRFAHSVVQKDYLFWKYRELQNIVNCEPKLIQGKHWKTAKVYESWQFGTCALPEFLYYWNLFCPNGHKIIPHNISKLLTEPISLAVWFMDDGYKRNDCNAFRLSTDGFTLEEQKVLQNVLENNFRIKNKLHKKGNYWNIYIPKDSANLFVEIIKPYIVPNLLYKIALAP